MIWTLRALAWSLSWLVVWLVQLADALDYRRQVMEQIEYRTMPPKHAQTVQVRYERRGRAKPHSQPLEPDAIPIPVKW